MPDMTRGSATPRALPHEIVTVVGRTGSGKTSLITDYIAPRHQRRLTLDLTGECRRLFPSAPRCGTVKQVLDVLHAFDEAHAHRWHIILELDMPAIGALLNALVPMQPHAPSIAAAWGGLCLECYEIDMLAPNDRGQRDTSPIVRHAYQRGRHVGLSILGATQRPAQVDRTVTAMSQHTVSFAMHEPLDVRWLERIHRPLARVVTTQLEKYEAAWYDHDRGELFIVRGNGADRRFERIDPPAAG